ncbi:MAG: hypothetical protein HY291_02650 [Planctomycetes bacterium]|nr:hypothetical protein [Planctomycetota bacterium]
MFIDEDFALNQGPVNYERAVGGSLLGLGVQAAAAGLLLGLGLWTGDSAVLAGAWLAAAGLPVWIVLAIVHQQHRLERLEALEAEELAKRPGVEQTIFERTSADLSVARRRLDQLFKWVLPAVSLLVGLYLAGAGLWLAIQNATKAGARAEAQTLGFDPLMAMAFCAGLGLLGFLVGRFVAGMARVREWQLMRGGAGFLMSAVVGAVALTLGLAGAKYELPALLRWLAVVIPVFMVLIGAEVLLNLVLNVYRPRKPGETPRAAFDARLLGLLTTPEGLAKAFADAVNYQFGFEITHSWFWQLLGRAALPLLGFAVGALLLVSCLVHVEPSQQALVTTFGRLDGEPLGPGLHLKWPWPLSSFELFDVTRIHEIRVGSIEDLKPGEPVLWTNEHSAKDEGLLIVAASPLAAPNSSTTTNRAPAIALVIAEVSVQYRIKDLKPFVACGAAGSVEAWLKCSAERAVTAYLYGLDEQEVLGPARLQAGDRLRERIQRESDANGLGIEVLFAGILSVHPHHKAAEAFHESVQALQERETKIEQAQQERIKTLSQVAGSPDQAAKLVAEISKLNQLKNAGAKPDEIAAGELAAERAIREGSGEASQELAKAEADRWTRENAERGKAERFLKELLSYRQAPQYFVARRYLEVISEGLGSDKVRKYVLAAERDKLTVRMDLKDQDLDLPMNLTPEK